jgi:hypothetical protein
MLRVFLTWFAAGAGLVLAAFVVASAVFLKSDAEPTRAANAPEPTANAVQSVSAATEGPLVFTTVQPVPTVEATAIPSPTAAPVPTLAPAGPVVLGRPAGLAAAIEGQAVVLTWQAVPGAGYYNVYRSEVSGGGTGAVYTALGSAGTPRFVDASAQRGVTYYYVVTASAGGNETGSSGEASIKIP